MKSIKLNSHRLIDLDRLIDSKLLIQANSGGGKSWAIRRILEESHGKVQQIILDPEGEFSTLREKYEYILCGKGQDAPAEPRSAALLARKLLELGASAVIDLYELHPQERKRFVRLFLEAMVNAPKELWHPVLVIIDEAHTFAPEKGESEALNAVTGLASLGRKRGFGVVLATQRISKLHKDAAAECNNKMIGRTGLDIDRKRAAEEIGFTAKDDVLSLRTLEPGEFYCFGPAISMEVVKERVGEVKTSHPHAGARMDTRFVPPTDKIKKILGQLADLPAEAKKEAETVDELKRELVTLRREKNTKVADPRAIELAVAQETRKWVARVAILDKTALQLRAALVKISRTTSEILGDKSVDISTREFRIATHAPFPMDFGDDKKIKTAITETPTEEKPLRAGAMKMLNWLASVERPLTKQRLATLSGFTASGGTFLTYISELKRNGWIEGTDVVTITEQGRIHASVMPLPAGEELLELWKGKFREGAGKILSYLYGVYPESAGKDEIGFNTGFEPSGGTFQTYLSELRRNDLVQIDGDSVTISKEFFE